MISFLFLLLILLLPSPTTTHPATASDTDFARRCFYDNVDEARCIARAKLRRPLSLVQFTTESQSKDYRLNILPMRWNHSLVHPSAVQGGQTFITYELGWVYRANVLRVDNNNHAHNLTHHHVCVRVLLRHHSTTLDNGIAQGCAEPPFFVDFLPTEARAHMIILTTKDPEEEQHSFPLVAKFFNVLPPNPFSEVLPDALLALSSNSQQHEGDERCRLLSSWYCTSWSLYGSHWPNKMTVGRHEPTCAHLSSVVSVVSQSLPQEVEEESWCRIFERRTITLYDITTGVIAPRWSFAYVLRQKLDHDVHQLQWLLDTNATLQQDIAVLVPQLIDDYQSISNALTIIENKDSRLRSMSNVTQPPPPLDCRHFDTVLDSSLNLAGQVRFRKSFNRVLVHPSDISPPTTNTTTIIADMVHARETTEHVKAYRDQRAVVVDNVLSPQALKEIRMLLRTSTIWTDVRPGFLGAYFDQGMEHSALVQLASELSSHFPSIICGRPIQMIWAYSYDTEHNAAREDVNSSGIHLHADPAAVNINLWITQDDASLDLERGGMVVYEGKPLTYDKIDDDEGEGEFDFDDFNSSPEFGRAWIESHDTNRRVVPHRANRMVVFDSMLFHETDVMRFRRGHDKRRINLTFLFGKPGQECVSTYFGSSLPAFKESDETSSVFGTCGGESERKECRNVLR
jgi:hypothetical protein